MKAERRTIRKSRAIGIPKSIFTRLGLVTGMEVEVKAVGHEIHIKPIGFVCSCCGKASASSTGFAYGMCNDCSHKVEKLIKEGKSLEAAFAIVETGGTD